MNPGDEKLGVEFYKKLWQNPAESVLQSRPIFEEKEWIRILIPGNQLTLIDTLAEDHYKVRFAEHYQRFLESGQDSQTIKGTPLSTWSAITREVAEKLRFKKFFTVEQVASASDPQLMSIGMDVGMQPHDFKRLANAYLESASKTSEIMKREAEMDLIRSANEDLRLENMRQADRIKRLEDDMREILIAQQKPKRSHKKKPVVDTAADSEVDTEVIEE